MKPRIWWNGVVWLAGMPRPGDKGFVRICAGSSPQSAYFTLMNAGWPSCRSVH